MYYATSALALDCVWRSSLKFLRIVFGVVLHFLGPRLVSIVIRSGATFQRSVVDICVSAFTIIATKFWNLKLKFVDAMSSLGRRVYWKDGVRMVVGWFKRKWGRFGQGERGSIIPL